MADEFPYQLVWSLKAQRALGEIRSKAVKSGTIDELDLVIIAINSQLRTTPLALGKVYRSTGGVDEHKAFEGVLGIDFAVDVQRQFVLVRGCWSVPVGDRNGS